MKLLIITSILAFEKDIKAMLKEANEKTYLFKEVKGFRDMSEEAIENNWFASEITETESILFYAFVKKKNVDTLFGMISDFNYAQESLSQIHVVVLNIEKSNNPTLRIV